jgi:hypothetical protein
VRSCERTLNVLCSVNTSWRWGDRVFNASHRPFEPGDLGDQPQHFMPGPHAEYWYFVFHHPANIPDHIWSDCQTRSGPGNKILAFCLSKIAMEPSMKCTLQSH